MFAIFSPVRMRIPLAREIKLTKRRNMNDHNDIAEQTPLHSTPVSCMDLQTTTFSHEEGVYQLDDSTFAFFDDFSSPENVIPDKDISNTLHFNDFESSPSQPSLEETPCLSNCFECCNSRCILSLTLLEIEQNKTNFGKKTQTDQKRFLFDIVTASSSPSQQGKLHTKMYVLAGKALCAKAFIKVLGISHKRLDSIINLVETGALVADTLKLRNRRKSDKHQVACAWMEGYFKRIGDRMPHTQQLHLPHFLSKRDVYAQMTEELMKHQGLESEEILSLSHFYAVWNNKFAHCVIPKVSWHIYFTSNIHVDSLYIGHLVHY